MKKLLTLLGVFSILLVLAGCTTTSTVKYTEPSFVGLSIDGQNPNTGSDLVTFYKEKNELTLVKIELNNPDQLEIRSISIKGYSYGNSRFTEDSTTNTIYFYLNAGTILGLEEYTVTDLEYFDGADSKDVVISSSNNRFNLYVYKDIPLVAREGYELGQDNIQIDFNIADTDGVIDTESLVI